MIAKIKVKIKPTPDDQGEEICHGCNGSGEGMYEDTKCTTCGGGGLLYFELDDE